VSDTDRDIIEQVRAGNTRRYAVLVDRHKDRASTLAVRLTGNKQESEELVQDAFLRAFRNLDQFRGDAKFGTWFYRILYNLCMTKVTRRRGKLEALDVEDGNELDNLLVDDDEPSIHERLEDEELQEMISAEIKALPEKYGTIITLFYVQEMSYEEIVSVLNSPIGTVKTNLFRARSLLKERVLGRMKGEMKVA
jgi:RNA polymerase sigma-70 factor (ECF subfamily)